MTLLDHFRRRARWEHEDAAVRAEAVREIPSAEQGLLQRLAREDPDPRVRRAALRRAASTAVLAELARGDADPGVREEASSRLLEIAQGHDGSAAQGAVGGIDDARALASIVRGSTHADIRLLALGRIQDERVLATLAKTSDDSAVRREALPRVSDPALLADVAAKSEHKDTAMAAVDRVDDLASLDGIAERARNGGASRRARARLAQLKPQAVPAEVEEAEAPPAPVVAEGAAESPTGVEALADPAPAAAAIVDVPTPAAEEPPPPDDLIAGAPVAAPPTPDEPPADDAKARAAAREAQEKLHRARLARVEALLLKLESLGKAEPLALRDADGALREARDARADVEHAPAKLAQKVRAARAALFARTQPLREAEDWTRWSNAAIQEQLCERLEALVGRDDLEKVARELRDCDARWADARHAPKEEGEALRHRYQSARARLKARVDSYFASKSRTETENLKQKEALCEQAEALAESKEWVKAAEQLKTLQARWKEIGPVSHKVSERVWQRFRKACDHFFTRRQEDLKRRKEEWSANLAKKEALCERVEVLATTSEWEAAAAEVKSLQLEWRGVGAVKKSRSDEVWQRFRRGCDAFFERYKHKDAIVEAARRAEREGICAEIEALVPASAELPAPDGLAETVLALQARVKHQAPLAAAEEEGVARRFVEARNKLVSAWPQAFRGTELDPETARARKQKLLARVEALVAQADAVDEGPLTGEALARRLKEALATNTMGGAAEAESRRRAEAEEVDSARAAWKRLGPVPGESGADLEERFEKACERFQATRPRPSRREHSRVGAGVS